MVDFLVGFDGIGSSKFAPTHEFPKRAAEFQETAPSQKSRNSNRGRNTTTQRGCRYIKCQFLDIAESSCHRYGFKISVSVDYIGSPAEYVSTSLGFIHLIHHRNGTALKGCKTYIPSINGTTQMLEYCLHLYVY